MPKRVVISLLVVAAAALAPVAAPAAVPVAAFTISVEGSGPFAPGTAVAVALAAGTGDQFAQVEQCNGDATACRFAGFIELDANGGGSVEVRIRRYLAVPDGGAIDCAVSSCWLNALDYDSGAEASVPIEVDGTVPLVRPHVTLTPSDRLADRETVTVTGTGFEPFSYVSVNECAWTDTVRCSPGAVGFGFADADGRMSTRVPAVRFVGGADCARRRGLCHFWIAPDQDLDHLVIVALGFDPDAPSNPATATVEPSTGLRHDQIVTVHGAHFVAAADVTVEQCVDVATTGSHCRYLASVSTDDEGSFLTDVAVRRRVELEDCATAVCVLRVSAFPLDQVDIELTFDDSVPPPPVPTIAILPSTGLLDGQVVEVELRDAAPNSYANIQLCARDTDECRANVFQLITRSPTTVPYALPRMIGEGIDCAVVPCEIRVQIFGEESFSLAAPVTFDPDAPLARLGSVRVLPDAGLWDRQRVEVRGERLEPGALVELRQCVDPEASTGSCAPPTDGTVDSRGKLSVPLTVRRTLQLPRGAQDCAAIACYLVVGRDPAVAVALGFDRSGPIHGSDLPAQLDCVAWPTEEWPVGDLPEGVDAARVAEVGEQMVGPNGGDSVVVIHGGKVVYENYADGVTADMILTSFSMSKSFTSTMVGLLVDDGMLAVDERAPIDEWAAPDDPRNAITLRNILNMSSGLEWTESYSDPDEDVIQMLGSPDNAAYVIAKPLAFTPGSQFRYSTGDTMVLAKIVGDAADVSGDSYETYLHDRLFDPLGINPVQPVFDAAGTWAGGYATNTTTRNFAKLGLLYLRDGVWEDDQFLSSDWVDFVRTPGPSPGYGGQFWLNGDGSFAMIGFNGQSVQIVPQLDLIVAVNNGSGSGEMVELFRNAEPPSCGERGVEAVDDDATVRALKSVDVDVLANDLGGPVGLSASTLTVSESPEHGAAEIVNGKLRYRSDAGYTGSDTLAYVVCAADRERCDEASVAIEVTPLDFAFRPPIGDGSNRRTPGRPIYVPFRTPPGEPAVASVASVAVDCATDEAIGAREPVDAELHARVKRGGVWFWWTTTPTWTGFRDLEITLADGRTHAAHFSWRGLRSFSQQ